MASRLSDFAVSVRAATAVGALVLFSVAFAARAQSEPYGNFHVRLCALTALTETQNVNGQPKTATLGRGPLEAAAIMRAVEHVNGLDCTLIGPGCEDLVTWSGGRVFLNLTVWDVASFGPSPSARAASACGQQGGQSIIGASASSQTVAGTFVSNSFDIPWISHTATATILSEERFQLVARTAPAAWVRAKAVAALCHCMGWQQAVVIYNSQIAGISMHKDISHFTKELNITTSSISLSDSVTISNVGDIVQVLQALPHKVVILCLGDRPADYAAFFTYAMASGIRLDELTWIGTPESSLQELVMAEEAAGGSPDFFTGMIVPAVAYPDTAVSLADHLRASPVELTELTSVLRSSKGQPMVPGDMADAISGSGDFSFYLDLADSPSRAYDAVWATASSWARAAAKSVEGQTLTAHSVLKQLPDMSFTGTSGQLSWNSKWDVDVTELVVLLHNYHGPSGPGPGVKTVAQWTEEHGLVFEAESQLMWSDGSCYPESIPSDGLATFNPMAVILPAAAVIGVLLALLVFVLVRYIKLRAMINGATDDESRLPHLNLDSPLFKVIEFLDGYSKLPFYARRPAPAEAEELRDLVVRFSHQLSGPVDLSGQLRRSPELSHDLVGYLVGISEEHSIRATDPSCALLGDDGTRIKSCVQSHSDVSLEVLEKVYKARNMPVSRALLAPDSPGHTALTQQSSVGIGRNFLLDITGLDYTLLGYPSALVAVASESVHVLGLYSCLGAAGMSKLTAFASAIEEGYSEGGYHCKLHAADVTHRLVAILSATGLSGSDPMTRLAAMVAGIVHDYEHPQVNNSFLVNKGSSLAIAFNDQSPVENHSLLAALSLLDAEELDFLSVFVANTTKTAETETTREEMMRTLCLTFRSLVINMVLGTDMSKHFSVLEQFRAKMSSCSTGKTCDWSSLDKHQQMITLQTAIKVADLGHCSLELEQNKLWLERLEDELFAQGDAEQVSGLPISPLMDRNKTGVCDASAQVGFLKVIVLPLLSAWVEVFPECSALDDQARVNYRHWASLC